MTRKALSKFYCRPGRFFANVLKVSAFQRNYADPIPSILLGNVRLDKAHTVTDHVWINPLSMMQGEPFPVFLSENDVIGFQAIAAEYRKGRDGHKMDYTLASIRAVEIISKGEPQCSLIIKE